jgi:hypothetical protein
MVKEIWLLPIHNFIEPYFEIIKMMLLHNRQTYLSAKKILMHQAKINSGSLPKQIRLIGRMTPVFTKTEF